MIKTKEDITKYKVFFRRVNTTGNIQYQEFADAIYRENYLPSEILILNEDGVSANTNIEKRPQMKRLIQMIINDLVEIVYVYDRSRLFRDFYAFNYFVLLCRQHNVNIFDISSRNGNQKPTLFEQLIKIQSEVEE
ncbi:recombinase family protein [Niallia sp. Krafla_26]|uniref:recombinase family protein n=1 Tax=Niallia sp. Krafla_26 TaxID=3064703 RepID=UPI003D181CB9